MLSSSQNFLFPQRFVNILLPKIGMAIASDNRQSVQSNLMFRGHSL